MSFRHLPANCPLSLAAYKRGRPIALEAPPRNPTLHGPDRHYSTQHPHGTPSAMMMSTMDYPDCTLADDSALAPGDDDLALYGDGSICLSSLLTNNDSVATGSP
jgi:hypothetical protein